MPRSVNIRLVSTQSVLAHPEDLYECRLIVSVPADGAESAPLRRFLQAIGKACPTYEISTLMTLRASEIEHLQSIDFDDRLRDLRHGPQCVSVREVQVEVLRRLG